MLKNTLNSRNMKKNELTTAIKAIMELSFYDLIGCESFETSFSKEEIEKIIKMMEISFNECHEPQKYIMTWKVQEQKDVFIGCPICRDFISFKEVGICSSHGRLYYGTTPISVLGSELKDDYLESIATMKQVLMLVSPGVENYFLTD